MDDFSQELSVTEQCFGRYHIFGDEDGRAATFAWSYIW